MAYTTVAIVKFKSIVLRLFKRPCGTKRTMLVHASEVIVVRTVYCPYVVLLSGLAHRHPCGLFDLVVGIISRADTGKMEECHLRVGSK